MNSLRRELNALLARSGTVRPPALRRSTEADALMATDLPLLLPENGRKEARKLLEHHGWRVLEHKGWWLLDRLPAPEDFSIADATCCPEACCCLRLLRLHGEKTDAGRDGMLLRDLWKASEQGNASVERLAGFWHRNWAAALRRGEALPGTVLPCLQAVLNVPEADRGGK